MRLDVIFAIAPAVAVLLVAGDAEAYRTAADLPELSGTERIVWPGASVSYRIDGEGLPSVPYPDLERAVGRAARVWEEVPCSALSIEAAGSGGFPAPEDGVNSIGWLREDWTERGFPPDAAGATDITYRRNASGEWEIVEADIVFNAWDFDWHPTEGEHDPQNQANKSRNMRSYLDVDHGIPEESFLDALELLCVAGQEKSTNPEVEIPMVSSEQQLGLVADMLENAADRLNRLGNKTVLHNLPEPVFGALRSEAPLDGTSELSGRYGTQVLQLRAAVADLATIPQQLGAEMDAVARDVRRARNGIRRTELEQDLVDLNFQRDVLNQLTRCAESLTVAASGDSPFSKAAANAAAALVCANSIAQIGFAGKQRNIEEEIVETEKIDVLLNFEDSVSDRGSDIERLGLRLRQAANDMAAALNDIETTRRQGKRALSRALFLGSDDTGRVFRVNTTLRRRLNTKQERYDEARVDAIRMAFLAKRAIEQRFGIELATIDQDMTLVDPPANWESDVCKLDGIDYEEIRDPSSDVDNFSDGFVGDYVTKLENFVESYRLDFPFQNGKDTAVVSLRDDIQDVRAMCPQPVPNLIS